MMRVSFCFTTGTTSCRGAGRRHWRRKSPDKRGVDACYRRFAGDALGGVDAERLRLARFVLADAPKAAVGPHLHRGDTPPLIVDEMITITYHAILRRYGRAKQKADR